MCPITLRLYLKRICPHGNIRLLIFWCSLICLPVLATAQFRVQGTVTDGNHQPLPGVSVAVKNTNTGTTTGVDGSYMLDIPSAQDTLVFSYLGFTSQTIAVGGKTTLDIVLSNAATDLNEVVVVGYGTQKKKDLTGAVSVVDAGKVQDRQATTVAEALQGLATGLRIRGGGQPGSEANIEIRGTKNLTGSNPLYVIDGMITTANRDFNPNDIASIQILKDASAAAIYGSRAANGVIIITTKKGQEGPLKINFSGKASVQTIPRYDLMGTEDFARVNFMAYDNAGVRRQELDMDVHTDWQDVAYRIGNVQDYNLSFSGGSAHGNYYVSAGYFGNKGAVIDTRFDRYSLRVNSSGTKGILSIGENLSISDGRADEMSGNPIIDVVRMLPTIPVYDSTHPGGYGYGDGNKANTFGTNPLAIADLEDRINENFRVRGNFWAELQLFPFLKYRLNLGYETSNDHYSYLRKEGNWTLNQAYDPAIANENRARYQSGLIENTLNFDKDIRKHSIHVVLGQTYQRIDYGQIWGTKRNILQNPSTGSYYPVLDQGSEPQTGGYLQRAILLSYLGRLEYSYNDKYLLNAVVRRDGSSRLSPLNRWGNFPSISAAWRINREDFFAVPWIDDLKVRASYGQLGNSDIGYWDWLATINTFSTIAMGRDSHIEPGGTQVQLVNKDLRWETLTEQNYGFDATFLNGRLSASAEYYIAKTTDVLTGMPIALTTGNDGGNPLVNAADIKNQGFEFTASWNSHRQPVQWNITANLTTVKNKVLGLGYNRNNIYVGNTVTEVGHPIGMWYVLQTDGLFRSAEEVAAYKNKDGKVIQPDAGPGDIRFVDNNGDGQITNADKTVVASPWPDVELGLNGGASYKNFEFSMSWFGAFGATVFNGPRSVMGRFDDNSNYLKGIRPWTPEHPHTSVPRAYYGTTLNSRGDTERWLEDGSFFRLKFVSLSYRFPEAFIERIGFSDLKVSVSGQNLLTFTGYSGLDPEFANHSIWERGYDFGAFPNVKMYSVGLQFGF